MARKQTGKKIKSQKPVFSVGTLSTVLLLAALIGFAFYLNREKKSTADATPTSEEITYLFAATEGSVTSIEIKPADGESVRVARNAEKAWAVELPLEAEADQGLAEAAASQISALQVLSPIEGKPGVFGFDAPAYMITIEFVGGKKHTLEVGDNTPTNSGYYVRIDQDNMMITNLSGIDSLLQLVNFPPYLNPPTPTSLPATETLIPPTEAVTVTPTP